MDFRVLKINQMVFARSFVFAILVGVGLLSSPYSVFAAELVTDNFDSYPVGNVPSDNGWTSPSSPYKAYVNTTEARTLPNSLQAGSDGLKTSATLKRSTSFAIGDSFSWYMNVTGNGTTTGNILLVRANDGISRMFYVSNNTDGTTFNICNGSCGSTAELFANITKNEWHWISITRTSSTEFSLTIDENTVTGITPTNSSFGSVTNISWGWTTENYENPTYLDDFGSAYDGGVSNSSRILTINTPPLGHSTTSSNINFSFDYYSGVPFVDRVGLELYNVTTGLQEYASQITIIGDGELAYNTSVTGLSDGSYTWRAFVANSNLASSTKIYSKLQQFYIGQNSYSSTFTNPDSASSTSALTLECDQDSAVANSVCNLIAFLIVPSPEALNSFQNLNEGLSEKFPFAYAYDFKDSIESLYNGSQTQSATISYDFNGYGTLTLLSEQMIANISFVPLIKTIFGYLMWLMFAIGMYRRTLKIHDNTSHVS